MESDPPPPAGTLSEDVDLKDHEPPVEEIIANVLHILSSSTRMTPLLYGSAGHNKWDPFPSLSVSMHESDDSHRKNILIGWLNMSSSTLISPRQTSLDEVMDALVHISRIEKVLKDKPGDDLLWHAGLSLMKTHLYPNDDVSNSAPISPHLLLLTVMDSYYCNDNDLELGELSAIGVEDNDDGNYMLRVPSSIGMFYLRTFLISHALESAEESIPYSEGSRGTVRWRRLKSMTDDARSLFRRMLFDYSAKALNNTQIGNIIPKSLEHGIIYDVDPNFIISMATFCYVNILFPSCRGVLTALLLNKTKSHGRGTMHRVLLLQSCYESLREMTTLLALEIALVNCDYSTPSRCVQRILRSIESQETYDFFDCIKSQKTMTCNGSRRSNSEEDGAEIYLPWKDKRGGFIKDCLSLEEDLILYPSIGIMQAKPEESSRVSFYDETGIALLAYWKLWAQATGPNSEISSLPSPYSSSYLWTLLFPRVLTLLSGWSSPTIEKMLACGLSLKENKLSFDLNSTIISLGLEMLHTILTKTPAIMPTPFYKESTNPAHRWAHSTHCLQSTIRKLLSHVLRTSSLEMTSDRSSSSDIALKYSSLEVMSLARKLIQIYSPDIQVEAVSILCQALKKDSQVIFLLPRVIDFIRPIIMDMCANSEQYNHCSVALRDMKITIKISNVLDTFLQDLHDSFDDPERPVPRNVHEFMMATETFSAVFAVIRLLRIWTWRYRATRQIETEPEVALKSFEAITRWVEGVLSKLHYFDSYLTGLINIWETSDNPPHDWHLLFLLQSSLRDAFNV